MKVLYDGWPLVRNPSSPAGLHLLAILDHLPESIQPVIALPGLPPPWLPELSVYTLPTAATEVGRLTWEQHHLPGIARRINAAVLHMTVPRAPLRGAVCVVSPAEFQAGNRFLREVGSLGVIQRLRDSFGLGGLARAAGVLWPEDFPEPGSSHAFRRVPPIVPHGFHPQTASNGRANQRKTLENMLGKDPPETFILYQGPTSPQYLYLLIEAWRQAAGPIGGYHPLLVAVSSNSARKQVEAFAGAAGLSGSLKALAGASPQFLSWLYQECTAVFHPVPAFSPWGGSIHHGLACGRAIVAAENVQSDAMVGPAGYLIPANDPRRLAAALITVVVEEEVKGKLESAARQRAAGWKSSRFGQQLLALYRDISKR